MARLPRPDLAGIPQHVVQRGNNRLPCFLDDEDRQRYLQCLLDALVRFDCRRHGHKALGSDPFRAWVESRIGRFATARPPGRPP